MTTEAVRVDRDRRAGADDRPIGPLRSPPVAEPSEHAGTGRTDVATGREASGADREEGVPIDPDDADEEGLSISRRVHDLDVIAVVSIAGVLGALARYGISERWPARPGHIPWSTLAINLVGSFALGFLLVLLVERFPPTRYARAFIAIGFLGAFTTFSTFAVETVGLVTKGAAPVAAEYVGMSVIGGLLCAATGVGLARKVPHRHPPPPTRQEVDHGS